MPVLAANPVADVGGPVLMDVINAVYPSPEERPAIKAYKTADKENPVERTPDPNGPLVARIFRTFYDPFAGLLSYARIFSGKIAAGGDAYNINHSHTDRPSHMYVPQGGTKGGLELKEATVGDIIVLTKLKSSHTGDTLTSKDDSTYLEPFDEPDALLNYGIEASDKKAEDKMAQVIHKAIEEDPSLRFERDPGDRRHASGWSWAGARRLRVVAPQAPEHRGHPARAQGAVSRDAAQPGARGPKANTRSNPAVLGSLASAL